MKNTKTLFIINVTAFILSIAVLLAELFQNLLLSFFSFLKAADGTPFDVKDLFDLLPYILAFAIPQLVFFYTFFLIKKSTDIIIYDDPTSEATIRYYKLSTVLAIISVFLILLYLASYMPILIWGFQIFN